MKQEYQLIRSERKSIAIQVTDDGEVIVRAPLRMPECRIEEFVGRYDSWIQEKIASQAERRSNRHIIAQEERQAGYEKARRIIPERVAYFAGRMGVDYGRITIREQKTRWGSCSSKGNLNFNWKLVLTEPELLDYVVVHELAHRREMNHSSAFWAVVAQEIPDYQERRRRLKKYTL